MSKRSHILIVDDEAPIRLFLGEVLKQAGYRVTTVISGEEALLKLHRDKVDLILLDLKMDGLGGLQVMAEVEKLDVPPVIIILTAFASLDSAIEAMRLGGHDYLIKPCSTDDLLISVERGLRIRRETMDQQRMLRLIENAARQLQSPATPDTVRDTSSITRPHLLGGRGLLLDRSQGKVTRLGQPVHVTPTELRLLIVLMEYADQVVTFSQLANDLNRQSSRSTGSRQSVSTHMWRLRQKLGDAPDGAPYIVNVRGQGFKFISGSMGDGTGRH